MTRVKDGKTRQGWYRKENEDKRGVGQVNLIVPLEMRGLFQTIAGRLRQGAPEIAEAIRGLADLESDAKIVLVPADRAHLVELVMAADSLSELEARLIGEPSAPDGQMGDASATISRLGELIETTSYRTGVAALAMRVEVDRLTAAARSIDDLLVSQSRKNDRAKPGENPLSAIHSDASEPEVAAHAPAGLATLDPATRKLLRDAGENFGLRREARLPSEDNR